MLLTFRFKNYLSFKDEQIFSMVPGRTRLHGSRIFRGRNHVRINKFAALFGANGSGKSNFIHAFIAMRTLIVNGEFSSEFEAFRFGEGKEKDSEFEVELFINNHLYSYGFTVNLAKKEYCDEWLAKIGQKEDIYLFRWEKGKKPYLNPNLSKKKDSLERLNVFLKSTTESRKAPFLYMANHHVGKLYSDPAIAIIKNVFDSFNEKLVITTPDMPVSPGWNLTNEANLARLKKYLCAFDTGISDVIRVDVSEEKAKTEIPFFDSFKDSFFKQDYAHAVLRSDSDFFSVEKQENGALKIQKFEFVHFGNNDVYFDLHDESDGTKRLFVLLDILLWENDGTVFVVDELDRCLHPELTREFINQFLLLASEKGFKNQLIVTTHESRLMNFRYLRRDEIWFVENEKIEGSRLFPFDAFNARFDKVIEKAYLDGRFGGVPVFEKSACEDGK
jgi:AAA15 family ATPase/GTPase